MSGDSNEVDYELQLWVSEQEHHDQLNMAQFCSDIKSSSSDQDIKELVMSIREPRKRRIIDSTEKQHVTQVVVCSPTPSQSTPQKRIHYQKLRKLSQQFQDNCPICLTPLDEFEILGEIEPCKHITCIECIKEWAEKYKACCPFCRGNFKNVWPMQQKATRMIRAARPLSLDLNHSKWQQDFDEFYQEEESEEFECMVCNQSHSGYLMLVCDRCDIRVCHTYCDPAILDLQVPDDNWYCLECRLKKTIYNKPRRN